MKKRKLTEEKKQEIARKHRILHPEPSIEEDLCWCFTVDIKEKST